MTAKKTQHKGKTAAEKLRESRIEELRRKIALDEETIAEMDACIIELSEADINGLNVMHRIFGTGTVTERSGSAITVRFGTEKRRFIMPSAFVDGFLRTDDESFNGIIGRYKDMCKRTSAAKREISEMNRLIDALIL